MTETPEKIQPLLLDIQGLCKCLSIARPTYYKISANGMLGPLPIKLCRKVLYSKAEIEQWVARPLLRLSRNLPDIQTRD